MLTFDTRKKSLRSIHGNDGMDCISARKELLYYTLKRLGLDAVAAAGKPVDQQIVVVDQRITNVARANDTALLRRMENPASRFHHDEDFRQCVPRDE